MLQWAESFELGVEEIDSEHREMFNIARDLEQAAQRHDLEKCSTLVDHFIESCKRHFENEEAFLARIGYPDIEVHSKYHKSLVNKAKALKVTCGKEIESERMEKCYLDTINLLLDDIVRGDLSFKSYLQMQRNSKKID